MEQKQTVEARLSFIEKKIDSLMLNQYQIKSWLIGDEDNELNVGVLPEMVRMKNKIERLEKWRDKAIYILVGMSIAAGVGVGRIIELLKHSI